MLLLGKAALPWYKPPQARVNLPMHTPSLPDRRHFLATLFGASAAGLATSHAAALSYKGENLRYGLVTYQWGADWPLPTLIANCEQAGALGVELRVEHAHGVSPELNTAQREEVRARFQDSPVEVLGMGTNCAFHSPDPTELKAQLDLAREFIKLSHDIGGGGVKVKPDKLPKDVPVERTLEQIGRALAELGDHAIGFGQEIRLEVHGDVTDLGHIRTLMEIADRPNVRVCWNSNKVDLAGEGLEANFAKVAHFLGQTVHVREVGADDYPYDKLAELLVGIDYAGWVLLEASSKPEDRVAALGEQKTRFMELVQQARAKA
jgi:sugar phosphate isomerase/epimerase